MDVLEVVCELWDVPVVNFFGAFLNERVEPVSICCKNGFEKKKQDACGAERHVENEFFAEVNEAAVDTSFELLWTTVLGELGNRFQELSGG